MKISIASDHAGFEQKQALVGYLASKGHDVIDRGPDCDDRVDYPDYAARVRTMWSTAWPSAACSCAARASAWPWPPTRSTGSAPANVTSPLFAALAREHNDANVVAVSGRFIDESVNREILDAFVSTSFGGGRHAGRVEEDRRLSENE